MLLLTTLTRWCALGAILGVDDPLTTSARDFYVDGVRPPGTLLLNMLSKNEAEHFRRTLPVWAKIIDYWVIGIDELTTDDSVAVVHEILGHIPGKIVTIRGFDGMGPSWSELVRAGYESFPQATHGIVADADFAPLNAAAFDKNELDIRASKLSYTMSTENHQHHRALDWIYRNVKGAHVARRTHQQVKVPSLPDQATHGDAYRLHVNSLPCDERTGGFQDRTGSSKKWSRYTGWLLKDLQEFPDDTRSVYYTAHASFDHFLQIFQGPTEPTAFDWRRLAESEMFFQKRIALDGRFEERYFAVIKLAEIYDRFRRGRGVGALERAHDLYALAIKIDAVRCDGYFYQGQLFRLTGKPLESLEPLLAGATLLAPRRSLFNWEYLYTCLIHLELARSVSVISDAELRKYRPTARSSANGTPSAPFFTSLRQSLALGLAGCRDQVELDEPDLTELTRISSAITSRIATIERTTRPIDRKRPPPASKEEETSPWLPLGLAATVGGFGARGSLHKFAPPLKRFLKFMRSKKRLLQVKARLGATPIYKSLIVRLLALQNLLDLPFPLCVDYRRESRTYATWFDQQRPQIEELLSSQAARATLLRWTALAVPLLEACR